MHVTSVLRLLAAPPTRPQTITCSTPSGFESPHRHSQSGVTNAEVPRATRARSFIREFTVALRAVHRTPLQFSNTQADDRAHDPKTTTERYPTLNEIITAVGSALSECTG